MCAGALTHKFGEWDVLFKENSGIKAQFLLEILGVPRFGIIENLILFVNTGQKPHPFEDCVPKSCQNSGIVS